MFKPVRQKLLLSASTTSAQSHTAVIDTLGYDNVTIGVHFTSVAETTPEITMKLGEGDTTSTFTDIVAFVGGTATSSTVGFVIPGPATSTSVPQVTQFDVDTRHRKRYLLLTVTPFTTKTITSFTTSRSPEQGPPSVVTNEGLQARIGG